MSYFRAVEHFSPVVGRRRSSVVYPFVVFIFFLSMGKKKESRRKTLIASRLNRIFTGKSRGGEAAYRGDARLLLSVYRKRRYPVKFKKKVTIDDVREFLDSKAAYGIHANARKVWSRNKIFVSSPGYQFACDLIVLSKREIVAQNGGHKYILSVLDQFSRRAVTAALKSKSGLATEAAFRSVLPRLRKLPQPPYAMSSDLGREFHNQHVKRLFRREDFHLFESSGETHTAIVERFNRTLQTVLFRHFETNNTLNWVDHLEDLTESYNNTVHRSLGVAPNDVDLSNFEGIYDRLYSKYLRVVRKKPRLKVGDMVRLNLLHTVFGKSYEETFSYRVYYVDSVSYPDGGVYPMYKIKDLRGSLLPSRYYYHELKRIPKEVFLDRFRFPIEKIIRKKDGKSLVKFIGYDESWNEWLRDSDIKDV